MASGQRRISSANIDAEGAGDHPFHADGAAATELRDVTWSRVEWR
jgi:hypothetical protein